MIDISGIIGVLAVSTCSTHLVILPGVPYILVGERSRGAGSNSVLLE